MRNIDNFKDSLSLNAPPKGISEPLKALWWDAKGEWEKAHEAAQSINNDDGSRVHAYLHRKEGDEGNASYWYSRAGKPKPRISLIEEWGQIVKDLL